MQEQENMTDHHQETFAPAKMTETAPFEFRDGIRYSPIPLPAKAGESETWEIRPATEVTAENHAKVTEQLSVMRTILTEKGLLATRGKNYADDPNAFNLRITQPIAYDMPDAAFKDALESGLSEIRRIAQTDAEYLRHAGNAREEDRVTLQKRSEASRARDARVTALRTYSGMTNYLKQALIDGGLSTTRSIQGHSPNEVQGALRLFSEGDVLDIRDSLLERRQTLRPVEDRVQHQGITNAILLLEELIKKIPDGADRLVAYDTEHHGRMERERKRREESPTEHEATPDNTHMGGEIYLNSLSAANLSLPAIQEPLCNDPKLKQYLDIRNSIRNDIRGMLKNMREQEDLSPPAQPRFRSPTSEATAAALASEEKLHQRQTAQRVMERLQRGERRNPSSPHSR